ncbi:hypothetical protein ACWNT8_09050 [Pigmentibacter ruber]
MRIFYVILSIILLDFSLAFSLEDKIFIAVYDRPPFVIFDKDTGLPKDGILYKQAIKILEKSRISYEFKEMPLIRSLEIIKKNEMKICTIYAYKSKDREAYSFFSEPYYSEKRLVLVALKNSEIVNKAKTLEELLKIDDFKIQLKVGYSYGLNVDQLVKKYKNFSNSIDKVADERKIYLTSDNILEMLYNIVKKKADYMLINGSEFEYFYNLEYELKENLQYKLFPDIPEGEKRYFMCSYKVGEELINKINKTIKFFQK